MDKKTLEFSHFFLVLFDKDCVININDDNGNSLGRVGPRKESSPCEVEDGLCGPFPFLYTMTTTKEGWVADFRDCSRLFNDWELNRVCSFLSSIQVLKVHLEAKDRLVGSCQRRAFSP